MSKKTSKKTASKAVATKPSADLAEVEQNVAALWAEESETGFEDTTREDYAVPFLVLLQKGSPQCDEDDGAYIEGAKPGQFLDTSTGQTFEEVEIIPCFYRHAMVEWRDRDEGGGFVAQHEPGIEEGLERDESGRFVTDEGNYIADTRYFFCLRRDQDTGDLSPVVLSFTSTQLKKARTWMTRMRSIRATASDGRRFTLPMFANLWRLTSVGEQNDKGSWKGYKIELIGPIHDPEIARQAKDARDMFKSAADSVKPPEAKGKDEKDGDDVPF